MSAAVVSLPAAAMPTAPRSVSGQNSNGGDPVDGKSSFDHLIGGSKSASARGEVHPPQSARASKDERPEAKDKPAEPAKDKTVDNSDAQCVAAGDEHKAKDDGSESPKDSATPTDGGSLLAWLQASATPAPTAPTVVVTAPTAVGNSAATSAKLADSTDLTRLLGRTVLSITPDAAKPPADGLSALATTLGSDGDSATLKAFHLPPLAAMDSREPDKAVVAALDALISKGLAAVPEPAVAGAATALAATPLAATMANVVQDRPGVPVTDLATLPLALRAPLDAESQQLPQQIGERVQWLVGAGVQEARLQLHPRDLGAVMVQVRVEAGNASVFFSAEHPAARAALEAALPQLREQFASGGLQLAQAQVSSQSNGWSFGGSQTSDGRGPAGGNGGGRGYVGGEGSDVPVTSVAPRVVHIGLLDDYA